MKRKRINILIAALITSVSMSVTPFSVYASETTTSGEETEQVADEATEDSQENESESLDTYVGAVKETEGFDKPQVYVVNDNVLFIEFLNELAGYHNTSEDEESYTISIEEISLEKGSDIVTDFEVTKKDYDEYKKTLASKAGQVLSIDDYEVYVQPYRDEANTIREAAEVTPEPAAESEGEYDESNNYPTFDTSKSPGTQKADDVRWDIMSIGSRKTNFNLEIKSNNPVKLEIFYSAKEESPQISLLSPNKRMYSNKGNTEESDIKIINRKGQTIADYPDIKYDIIYIYTTNEQYAGKWQVAYSITSGTYETILVSASVDDGWEDFVEEYKTSVRFFILYYFEEGKSYYNENNIIDIVKADEPPVANNLATAKEDEPEQKDLARPIIILTIVGILIGMALCAILFKKLSEERRNQKGFKIDKANKRLRRRRAKENNQLEKVSAKYADDYSDDEYEEQMAREEREKFFKNNEYSDDDYSDEPISDDRDWKSSELNKDESISDSRQSIQGKQVSDNKQITNNEPKKNPAPRPVVKDTVNEPQATYINTPVKDNGNMSAPVKEELNQPISQPVSQPISQGSLFIPIPIVQPAANGQGMYQGMPFIVPAVQPQVENPQTEENETDESKEKETKHKVADKRIPSWHKDGERHLGEDAPSWKKKDKPIEGEYV